MAHGDSSSACDLQTRALLLMFSSAAKFTKKEKPFAKKISSEANLTVRVEKLVEC